MGKRIQSCPALAGGRCWLHFCNSRNVCVYRDYWNPWFLLDLVSVRQFCISNQQAQQTTGSVVLYNSICFSYKWSLGWLHIAVNSVWNKKGLKPLNHVIHGLTSRAVFLTCLIPAKKVQWYRTGWIDFGLVVWYLRSKERDIGKLTD